MTEDIYGDVLFIINFSMDFLSLFICGSILRLKMKTWRVILSATLGGIYGVGSLFLDFSAAVMSCLTLLCALVMCFIAFRAPGVGRLLLSTALFYGTGMLLVGIMTAIYAKLGRYTGYISIGGSIATVFGSIPIWLFAVLAALSVLLTKFIGRIFSEKSASDVKTVVLGFGDNTREIEFLVDGGNLLCEPITGTPVIFISEKEADMIPEGLFESMKNGIPENNYEIIKKLRFIPLTTVSGSSTVIAAVPDRCYVKIGGKFEEKKALVSVNFEHGDFGGFEGLVPKTLI